ncbi:hypothetical protein NEUTE1DRAFT_97121, partial [Neurospora tetrasperma FGSC 2508]
MKVIAVAYARHLAQQRAPPKEAGRDICGAAKAAEKRTPDAEERESSDGRKGVQHDRSRFLVVLPVD